MNHSHLGYTRTSTSAFSKACCSALAAKMVILLILSPVQGNAPSNNWTPADIVRQESASQFTFSPDGTMVAWVKSRNSTEKDRDVTDLYLTRLDRESGGSESSGNNMDASPYLSIQLTRSEESDRNPFFSRDGRLLYFLSSREDGNKLWAMNLYGGEPYEVHEFDEGIRNIHQLKDGTLLFLSQEGDLLIEAQRKERKDNTQIIEDTVTFKPSRLFSFDALTRSPLLPITSGTWNPESASASSRECKHQAVSHSPMTAWDFISLLSLHPILNGAEREFPSSTI